MVTARQVLTPLDLERDYGLTGGHPMHGEHGLDQCFLWRPLLGHARYRLALDGLYLAGAGAHPGRRRHRPERAERGPRDRRRLAEAPPLIFRRAAACCRSPGRDSRGRRRQATRWRPRGVPQTAPVVRDGRRRSLSARDGDCQARIPTAGRAPGVLGARLQTGRPGPSSVLGRGLCPGLRPSPKPRPGPRSGARSRRSTDYVEVP